MSRSRSLSGGPPPLSRLERWVVVFVVVACVRVRACVLSCVGVCVCTSLWLIVSLHAMRKFPAFYCVTANFSVNLHGCGVHDDGAYPPLQSVWAG